MFFVANMLLGRHFRSVKEISNFRLPSVSIVLSDYYRIRIYTYFLEMIDEGVKRMYTRSNGFININYL